MKSQHLYTIRWTQPYATWQMRPYLRHLRNQYDVQIENSLAQGKFDDAKKLLAKFQLRPR